VGPLAPYPRRAGLPFMTVPSRAMSVLAVAWRRSTCALRRSKAIRPRCSRARERALGSSRGGPSFTGWREVEPSGRASVSRPGIAMRRPTYL